MSTKRLFTDEMGQQIVDQLKKIADGGGGTTPIDTELNPETADNKHAAGAKVTADKLTELDLKVGVLMADHTLEEILGEETTEEDVESKLNEILS